MISQEIFKLDSKGKIRTWQYEVVGEGWRTIAGLQDGQKVVSEFTICTPKSQPTAELQAQFEADAEMKKKLKRDYHLTIGGTSKANYFKPMLAEKYDPARLSPGSFIQPKLDGIRCIAKRDGLWTRKGEAITSCPHIIEQLGHIFSAHPDLVLDGELYNHAFKENFNELASIIRKKTPDASQIAKAADCIEFHVYDAVPGGDFALSTDERLRVLGSLPLGVSIVLVHTEAVHTDDDVRNFFKVAVSEGFEGAMVRTGSAGYQQKRTYDLMKFKEFQTEEFPVLRVEEGKGNWAGFAKRIVAQLPDGREFGAGVKGDRKFTKDLLGRDVKIATIRFFELTPDGVPRFPVAIDFDRPDA